MKGLLLLYCIFLIARFILLAFKWKKIQEYAKSSELDYDEFVAELEFFVGKEEAEKLTRKLIKGEAFIWFIGYASMICALVYLSPVPSFLLVAGILLLLELNEAIELIDGSEVYYSRLAAGLGVGLMALDILI